jgi:hypothetical protein
VCSELVTCYCHFLNASRVAYIGMYRIFVKQTDLVTFVMKSLPSNNGCSVTFVIKSLPSNNGNLVTSRGKCKKNKNSTNAPIKLPKHSNTLFQIDQLN